MEQWWAVIPKASCAIALLHEHQRELPGWSPGLVGSSVKRQRGGWQT